jgi:hypothetical protein
MNVRIKNIEIKPSTDVEMLNDFSKRLIHTHIHHYLLLQRYTTTTKNRLIKKTFGSRK